MTPETALLALASSLLSSSGSTAKTSSESSRQTSCRLR